MSHPRDPVHGTPAACRAFLASPEANAKDAGEAPHARACAACAAALARRQRLIGALRRTPTPPAALATREFLAGIQERIVAGVEAASTRPPHIAGPVEAPAAPLQAVLDDQLACTLATPPASPGEVRWQGVRRAVIHDIAIRRAARIRITVWVSLAGAAAAALFLVLGPDVDRVATPKIVFADLISAPAGDFTVIRRGANR